jgi:hypothetical protein
MDLNPLKVFLSRKETKIMIISTLIGVIVQLICRRYIKSHPEIFAESHPEFFKEKNEKLKEKNKNPRFPKFLPRGGGITFTMLNQIIGFLANSGLLVSWFGGGGFILKQINKNAIANYILDASPQIFPDLKWHAKAKRVISVEGEIIYLDQCNQNLEYLFVILKDPNVSFDKKNELALLTLTKYLNLKTPNGRLNFVICIVYILYIFSSWDISSYHILIENLIKAIKEGKITKTLGRAIIRLLKRKNLPINPELLEVIDS